MLLILFDSVPAAMLHALSSTRFKFQHDDNKCSSSLVVMVVDAINFSSRKGLLDPCLLTRPNLLADEDDCDEDPIESTERREDAARRKSVEFVVLVGLPYAFGSSLNKASSLPLSISTRRRSLDSFLIP